MEIQVLAWDSHIGVAELIINIVFMLLNSGQTSNTSDIGLPGDLRIYVYIAPDVSLECSLQPSRFSSFINSHDIAEQLLNLTNSPVVKSELHLLIVQNNFFVVLRKLDHISNKGSENIQKHVYYSY